MKIMLITAADSIHAVRWANAYAERGNEVHFVSIKGHEARGDKFSECVQMHYLPHSGNKGYFLNAPALRKLWKQVKPDVVNVHYASGYGLLGRLSGIRPLVLSVWGSDVYDFPAKSKLNKAMVVGNLKCADAIASTSYAMAKQVHSLMNDPGQEITITPFGVDTVRFSPEGEKAPKDENVFLFGVVKKLTYKYGIDYILRAFAIFMEQWKSAGSVGPVPRLFICGKGENKPDFEALRDELGLQEYVDIQGYIPNEKIPALLRSFDVFCLGSVINSESFGVAAVEAMSCGVPLIATDVDGFKEVVAHEQTGFIVPRANAQAMADRMWQLYQDSQLRSELGKNGRERVLSLYDWQDNVKTLLGLLEKTAKRKG